MAAGWAQFGGWRLDPTSVVADQYTRSVALGVIAYGGYQIVLARYRRIEGA